MTKIDPSKSKELVETYNIEIEAPYKSIFFGLMGMAWRIHKWRILPDQVHYDSFFY